MKADISRAQKSPRLGQHRRERHFYRQVAIVDRDTGKSLVIARWYANYDGASRVSACVWASDHKQLFAHGGGSAKGGGYHRPSAALQAALSDAGIHLDEDIGGCGEMAEKRAMEAVARALTGKRKFFVVHANA